MSLFDDPELEFGDNSVLISQGSQDLRYFYSDPTVVTSPKTNLTMPDFDAKFVLKLIFLQLHYHYLLVVITQEQYLFKALIILQHLLMNLKVLKSH